MLFGKAHGLLGLLLGQRRGLLRVVLGFCIFRDPGLQHEPSQLLPVVLLEQRAVSLERWVGFRTTQTTPLHEKPFHNFRWNQLS